MEGENLISDTPEPLTTAGEESPAKRSHKNNLDLLSELPDLAIIHILSHLYVEEAVKTSFLSRQFRSLWESITALNFSDQHSGKIGLRFVHFVDTFIEKHRRKDIEKFSVKFCYDAMYRKFFDKWMKFACDKEVKSLHLDLIQNREVLSDYEYKLPKFLYDHEKLVELVTSCCIIRKNVRIYWRSLKLLTLTRAKLNEELISRVLEGCPVLNTLELRDWCGFDRLKINSTSLRVLKIIDEKMPKFLIQPQDELSLEISGPNLEYLELSGPLYRNKVRLSDVGSLVGATMDFMIKPEKYGLFEGSHTWFAVRDHDIAREVLESLCLVKELIVGKWFVKVLSTYEAYSLSAPWSERQCLTLHIPVLKWDHLGVASLLHSSPLTERLLIKLSHCGDMTQAWRTSSFMFSNLFPNPFNLGLNKGGLQQNNTSTKNDEYFWASWSTISKCPLVHLKTVKIIDFHESCGVIKPIFQFLEFLVRNSKALEDIVIQTSKYVTRETLDEALKLLSVPTASPDVVIDFEPPHFWVDPLFMYHESTHMQS